MLNVLQHFENCLPTGEKKFATFEEQMCLETEENVFGG